MPVTNVRSKWSSGNLVFTNATGTERFQINESSGPVVAGKPEAAVFTVGAETGGNTINVGIQLNDGNGDAIAQRACVHAYLSDDANGDSVAATAPATSVAIGTDGVLTDIVAKKSWMLVSEADGDIDIDIVETGGDTWYLVVVLPDGTLTVSDAITFAA